MSFLQKTIHELFEEQVEKTPNKVAVVFEDQKITYRELNNRSNQLAHNLIKLGLKREEIVAIAVERSVEMIIAVIGILKAGGCCQLIDQMNVSQRIAYMLRNNRVRFVIENDKSYIPFKFKKRSIKIKNFLGEKAPKSNLNFKIKPNNLAFIVYTSGSTGLPKGVMIEHRGVVNNSFNRIKRIPINSFSELCLALPTGFVAINHVIFSCLFSGATLHIYSDQDIRSLEKLFWNINRDRITILDISFQILSLYVFDYLEVKNRKLPLKKLQVILPAGEKLKQKITSFFLENYPKVTIFNTYGMSEFSGTIFNAKIDYSSRLNKIIEGLPPINDQAYVLNENFNVQPVNLSGELYVSGESLSRGYLKDSQKTKEVFLPHPFIKGKKIYRTGDIARILSDGNMEIIGRVDQQVKIRGNRVELREIENCLNQHPDVKQSVILAKEDKKTNETYLIAYYAIKSKISFEELRNYLRNILPEYMIPSYFVRLNKLPLNANGKLDRFALPDPNKDQLTNKDKYKSPTTELEKRLVKIWQEVLGIKKIGINDNFFDLGGHSLRAIKILSKINQELKISLQFKCIFQNPTVARLAKIISELGYGRSLITINTAKKKKYFHLSEMQKLNWKKHLKSDYFKIYDNFLLSFTLKGKLNKVSLKKSFDQIIARHESFRTNYKMVKGQVFQFIIKNTNSRFIVIDLSRLSERSKQQKIAKIIRDENNKGFDIGKDVLLRAKIIKLSNAVHILIISIDHISFDEESIVILLRELSVLYNGYLQKKPIVLPKISLQYKDYAEWEQNNLKKQKFDEQKKYWMNKFGDKIPILNLPYDNKKMAAKNFGEQAIQSIIIEPPLLQIIETYCADNNITLNIFFFSIFNLFLLKITNQSDLITTSLLSIRSDIKLEKTIGLLFVPLAIKIKIDKKMTFFDFIKMVKNNILEDFANKDFPFSEAIKEVDQRVYPSQYPNIFFQFYEKKEKEKFELSGLRIMEVKRQEKEKMHFDLCVKLRKSENDLTVFIYYKNKTFKSNTIENFLAVFKELSEKSISNSDKKLENIIG